MRTLKIYTLNNIGIQRTAALTMVAMLYVTSLVHPWKFIPFGHFPPILPSPFLGFP